MAKKTILVLNPISGRGHFDSWNTMVIRCLVGLKWRVLAVTPNIPLLKVTLPEQIVLSPDFKAIQLQTPKAFYLRPKEIYLYLKNRSRPLRHRFGIRRRQQSVHAKRESAGISPIQLAYQIRTAARRATWKPDLVLNLYLDTYSADWASWKTFEEICSIPWTGLHISPNNEPSEGWNFLQHYRGTLYLNKELAKEHQQYFPKKRFAWLPDVAETSLPQTLQPLTAEILNRAKKRKIIFLGGTIGGQKNLARWYDLINLADSSKYYFVQVGEIIRSTLSYEDCVQLDKFLHSPPENLFIWDQYLPEESTFNQIVSFSSVIFAVYRNFQNSSNMPAKAASFSRPILVSNRFMIGRVVTRYGIGRAVDEEDAVAMYEAILALTDQPPANDNYVAFNFDYSERKFGLLLSQHLTECLDLAPECC